MSTGPALFHLTIASLDGPVYAGRVRYVSLPGRAGTFGVLARHAPLLARLAPGEVLIHEAGGGPVVLVVSGGLAEIQPRSVNVLVDTAERSETIDQAHAQAARDACLKAIAAGVGDTRYAQARLELAIAELEWLARRGVPTRPGGWL
jgi:F-type H+-transporting ATPase subunit epsilon